MKSIQSLLKFLRPRLLERIDKYLLLHYPRVWATRVHYVVFYGLLANLVSAFLIIVALKPYHLRDFNNTFIWVIIIVQLAIFLFWLNSQALFNVEQEYGHTHYLVGIVETAISALCTIVIFSSSIIMVLTGIYKTANELGMNGRLNDCGGLLVLGFVSPNDLASHNLSPIAIANFQKVSRLAVEAINTEPALYLIGVEYTILFPEETREALYSYTINIPAGQAAIAEENNEIKLVEGGATSARDFRNIVPPQDVVYYYASYKAIDTCQSLDVFINDRENYGIYDGLGLSLIPVWHILFVTVGLLLVTILKQSNWRILSFSFLYLLLGLLLALLAALIFSSFIRSDFLHLNRYGISTYSETQLILVTTAVFVLFTMIQSLRSITAKRYKQFAFINFISLPIALGFLLFTIVVSLESYDLRDLTPAFAFFLLLYLLFSPLQKKMIIHLIALPRE